MRVFVGSRLVAMFAVLHAMCVLPGPAHAQQDGVNLPRWAVLDFSNRTSYGGADIGRQASDALAVQVHAGARAELISRSDIMDAIKQGGFELPLDGTDIQQLGASLDANAVIVGDIVSVGYTKKGQMKVVMAVRVVDVFSGLLRNGAVATGLSVARPLDDDDTLASEAIRKAAFAAVCEFDRFDLPIATVLSNEGTQKVLLNKGSRDGYYVGLNLLILRNGRTVGQVKVASVDHDSAVGVVTDRGVGIRPQDRAHAVYAMPPIPRGP